MVNRATGVGSMPGTDFAESTRVVWGETGDLPHLVELPARGAGASMTGRAVGLIHDLAFDLQPAGWRLTGSRGIDQRRATSMLAQDLEITEELAADRRDAFKVQLVGPWTLAATVERPRGDKALADAGARRDLAQALAEGLRSHCDDVRRRLDPAELVVQVDEPALPAVLAGAIPTASGFNRHRHVSDQDAAQALCWLADAILESGATPVLHCCAADIPFGVLTSTPFQALSIDVDAFPSTRYDELSAWLDGGRQAWLGVVSAVDPTGPEPTATDLTKAVLRWWRALGFTEPDSAPSTVLTPACGLAGASPRWAQTALGLCVDIARNLSEEQGRMDT
jgi:methionine synthase II (cobalamin-independent)